jgi:tetratricopeptide (TPR) repeat protein
VALFIQRALTVKPDFRVTNENAPAAAEICARLDGLPLAIELAAARSKLLPPQAMLARLVGAHGQRRLQFLIGGARDLPARQQTLRGTVAWSYDLLDAGEQRVFEHLSVFVGGCTLDAAAVCTRAGPPSAEQVRFAGSGQDGCPLGALEPDVLGAIESLVDKSLVRQADQPDGTPRLVMLETIREYGLERLEASGEAEATRRRHTDYCLALAEDADPKLQGPDQEVWLDRLETEHDNLRAALARSLTEASDAEIGLRLAGALSWFWHVRGHFSEGRRWLEQALAAGGNVSASMRAKALNGAGILAQDQGDYGRAEAFYEENLALFRGLRDKRGIATTLSNMGLVARAQGEHGRAATLQEESLALRQELGDKHGIAIALNNLGLVAQDQGDHVRSAALLEESLTLRRELHDKHGIAITLNNLGNLAHGHGDYRRASALYEENLALFRELGDKHGVATTLSNLGRVAEHEGDYGRAASLLQDSLMLRRELGDKDGIAVVLNNVGNLARAQGDYGRATALLHESLVTFRNLGDKRGIAHTLNNLGNVAHDQGDSGRAMALLEESLAVFRELGEKSDIILSLCSLGNAALDQGHHDRATALYGESLVLCQDVGDQSSVAACLQGLAGVANAREQSGLAARLFGAAEALREASGTPLPASGRTDYERTVAVVRSRLAENAFLTCWAEGRAMTPEQIRACAAGMTGSRVGASNPAPRNR